MHFRIVFFDGLGKRIIIRRGLVRRCLTGIKPPLCQFYALYLSNISDAANKMPSFPDS